MPDFEHIAPILKRVLQEIQEGYERRQGQTRNMEKRSNGGDYDIAEEYGKKAHSSSG